uniref:Uncharacterized protein n=1 Tax=Arundo donax TaxID=35708 RepID=A0A0A8Z774_ARUDO
MLLRKVGKIVTLVELRVVKTKYWVG